MEENNQEIREEKANGKIGFIKIAGILFVVFIVGFSIFQFVSSRDNSESLDDIGKKASQDLFPKKETRVENGVQIVELSWGRLNYNPEVIKVKSGMPVRIVADTERLTGCFRSFVMPELGIEKSFTEKDNTLEFTPTQAGVFSFGCAMGMGEGKMVVE